MNITRPPPCIPTPPFFFLSCRSLTKVRLKWVKNRGLDHIIDRDTAIKAAILLKDAIKRSPSSLLPARHLSPLQKPLGLTIPVLRFLRRYPTLFLPSSHPRFPSLPSFSLSPAALLLDRQESAATSSVDASYRLTRLLMMSRSRSLPLPTIHSLRYDLGLPADFADSDLFHVSRRSDGIPYLVLNSWRDDLAVSELQRRHLATINSPSYRDLKLTPISFPMRFPRGYGSMNKVKAWMEEFHRLPYISPYEDSSGIDPESDLMEKRVVGILHEVLSLMIHKKTKRNYLRGLREELNLPHRFTRVFTRYPGIFYLSLKCKTTTLVLREGYERGKLVEPHPIALVRNKYYYVMRTGVLYRGKGLTRLALEEDDPLGINGSEDRMGEEVMVNDADEEEKCESDGNDECYEMSSSGSDLESDLGSDEY
ncbi:protein WHAT'S THIS FACTOR 9, mitochondrial [Dioscorea cayenensis subsp. rotundata]|uniref:Protein WHAT'S THIS FACTOR 9, mitochondrial n=1 Tax=Dioscorea cayennensis subsp. rotundata TaxID=55577 RepID=A0AB40APH2_DIOCR|nr:protein WHAT'S THIS FACTOR 9, mitochondrial [Dioscorea cayenensis subsp. rotundata]XP_039116681.1 protein WHAT'S THIS FACTOR 9, mitochondrial [Dioscorea cayenensis subsp. rotundata]XP_039116682.1 protein WHAT'S THIS FACTOR 9, mitochondrial [Dioscorea cayenensis subsp. rotundata]XP_039116683.1 protein WHAT'S THIS FACTOR 9, mitochondrial [Dioscorea cayenensis subsp. rotundata]XP_039116684.1 protein WHAT'S THIS FACTOR 9, mitochondrial [Dioscorea cayenensis subsp. rotundata]XP_039116686.1 prote